MKTVYESTVLKKIKNKNNQYQTDQIVYTEPSSGVN